MVKSQIIFFILLSSVANSQTPDNAENIKPPSPLLTAHVDMLNELSQRRRVNTHFNNEQSVFYGLQSGFVNVAKGNITFVRRDLVTVGRIPIVLARVYDSSLVNQSAESDFSVGWQLSLAETIQVKANRTLVHRDDTATSNEFIPTTVGYKVNPAQNSDIKSVMFNEQALLQITYMSGWVKQFQKLGDRYRLVQMTDANGNLLKLAYIAHRISRIIGANNRWVSICRDDAGRIINVTDDNDRVVRYDYNRQGQLNTSYDLAGNRWRYQYNDKGFLAKVIDPMGQLASHFDFGKSNKVKVVRVRAKKHHYTYKDNITRVKDENKNVSTFVQNEQGITTSITNAEGFISSIVLNNHNQIIQLWHNGQKQAEIIYDDNGRPARFDINGKPTQMEQLKQGEFKQYHYHYDNEGWITAITGNEDKQVSYTYDTRGNVLQLTTDTINRTYHYANNGDVLSETETVLGQAANSKFGLQ
jgi:YD repeat-containing protein